MSDELRAQLIEARLAVHHFIASDGYASAATRSAEEAADLALTIVAPAIAAAEQRGRAEQRAADVKALRDRAALQAYTRAQRPAGKASGWTPLDRTAAEFAADYLESLQSI